MASIYDGISTYIVTGIPTTETDNVFINGYRIKKPDYFKSKARARAFEIALVLAEKKPSWSGVVSLNTIECIDIITFRGPKGIQLDLEVAQPDKAARDAMKLVPSFFDPGLVRMAQMKHHNRMWYLEINHN